MDSDSASKKKQDICDKLASDRKEKCDQKSNRSAKSCCSSNHEMKSLSTCNQSRTKSTSSDKSQSRSRGKASSAGKREISEVERSALCYLTRPGKQRPPCKEFVWQNGEYVRDECGSGIIPLKLSFSNNRQYWCKTPLTMYQATIGELGRKILCREEIIMRDIKPEPPCNIDEFILPLCRGYYRKKDCIRPCEDEHTFIQQGKKHYRNRVDRYWQPCLTDEEKTTIDVNEFAPHNVVLGKKMRRVYGASENPCW